MHETSRHVTFPEWPFKIYTIYGFSFAILFITILKSLPPEITKLLLWLKEMEQISHFLWPAKYELDSYSGYLSWSIQQKLPTFSSEFHPKITIFYYLETCIHLLLN